MAFSPQGDGDGYMTLAMGKGGVNGEPKADHTVHADLAPKQQSRDSNPVCLSLKHTPGVSLHPLFPQTTEVKLVLSSSVTKQLQEEPLEVAIRQVTYSSPL